MTTSTLTQLISRSRSRADMPIPNTFITDANVIEWLNEGIQLLHERMVMAFAENYSFKEQVINTVGGQQDYDLPTDFFKLYGIDYPMGGYVYTMKPYMFNERNSYRAATPVIAVYGAPPSYNIIGNKIRILPVPQGAVAMTMAYAPEAPVLINPGDTLIVPDGWERYVILYTAKQMLMKEESSVVDIQNELDLQDRQLKDIISSRDSGNPKKITDSVSINIYGTMGAFFTY